MLKMIIFHIMGLETILLNLFFLLSYLIQYISVDLILAVMLLRIA